MGLTHLGSEAFIYTYLMPQTLTSDKTNESPCVSDEEIRDNNAADSHNSEEAESSDYTDAKSSMSAPLELLSEVFTNSNNYYIIL